jgi:hypothetical protein
LAHRLDRRIEAAARIAVTAAELSRRGISARLRAAAARLLSPYL